MPAELTILSALLIGLAGGGHCLGMCGGIAAGLGMGSTNSTVLTLAYHVGRLLSYTLLGALLGAAAASIDVNSSLMVLRYLAGILLIAMALSIIGWWSPLQWLERAGGVLWQPVQSLGRRWFPPKRWPQGLALGLCWGLMPCGLIYSSLAWAATSANAAHSALLMLCFGLGTLPAMLAVSFSAAGVQQWLRRREFKLAMALVLALSGAWTLYVTWQHSGHTGNAMGDTPHSHHLH